MIVFASSITDPELYKRCAQRGIRVAAEPDSEVMPHAAAGSLFRSYNLILDTIAKRDDVEALVLVHQDAEITDPDFCVKLRRALSDPEVGVIGCVGAVGVRSIAWWEGSVTWASFVHRYRELGGGDLPAFAWNGGEMPAYARTGEVDTVDGFVMVLSPWTIRNVRFDESLGLIHGYDFDFCLQVRAAGRKVVTEDFKVVHHHSLDLISEPETWIAAHMRVAEKWDGRMPHVGAVAGEWKDRARRAEAEAAAARAEVVSARLKADARVKEVTDSVSWRLTEPLRRINAIRRAIRRR
ncbi:MAG TPA: glycosyltransferase [Solirubrobacteraceae bacterium]|nr:glycosyltransferase [Solirubrobacteraceae bacterium]